MNVKREWLKRMGGTSWWARVVIASSLTACVNQDILRAELTRQARSDLPCPNHVELSPLQERNGIATSYAVTGCGKRASYVLGPNLTWVLNASPEPEGKLLRP